MDIELDRKCADIENIISDSKFYFSHHRNHDPILKLSVDRLVKSWQVLTNLASNRYFLKMLDVRYVITSM